MSDGKAGPDKSRLIDDNLKRVFQQTLDEDIPDRFKDLLSQLKDRNAPASEEGER